jgi:hypothetical protein
MPKKKSGAKSFSAKRSLNAHAMAPDNKPPKGTGGQYEQDPERRIGQHTGAGKPPLMKK